MVGPQIGECVRNRPKVVHARCVCGVYEIYNSSAQLRAVALVLCIHMFAHTCISEMTSSVTVFCVKRLRCREREIYRAHCGRGGEMDRRMHSRDAAPLFMHPFSICVSFQFALCTLHQLHHDFLQQHKKSRWGSDAGQFSLNTSLISASGDTPAAAAGSRAEDTQPNRTDGQNAIACN